MRFASASMLLAALSTICHGSLPVVGVGAVSLLSSCKPASESNRTSASGARKSSSDAEFEDEEYLDEPTSDTRTRGSERRRRTTTSRTTPEGTGSDTGRGSGRNDDPETRETYPIYELRGTGQTENENERYATTSSLTTSLTATELTVNQTARTVDLRGRGGDDEQRRVDRDIRARAIGPSVFRRASSSERSALGDNNVGYVIFATEVRNSRGWTWRLSSPVPVFPWPGKRARFNALDAGPKSWTARATCTGCPQQPGNLVNFVFDLTVTVTAVSENGSDYVLRMETVINDQSLPANFRGIYYHGLPMARRATYTIDTSKGVLKSIDSLHLRKRDESDTGVLTGRVENGTILYRTCSVRGGDQNETFACP